MVTSSVGCIHLNRRQALAGLGAFGLAGAIGAPALAAGDRMKITYPARALVTMPVWMGHEEGFFAKHGIETELAFGAHPAGIATVLGGESQMTPYGAEQLINAQLRDPIMAITALTLVKSPFIMMGRPEVKTPADLKGKRIGVGRIGDPYYVSTIYVLKNAGLTEQDISWVPAGADQLVRVQMMRAGQLDAAFLNLGNTFALVDEGYPQVIDLSQDPSFYSPVGLGHTKAWVDANPDLVKRFLMGHAEATKAIYDDPDKAVAVYRKYDELPKETVRRSLQTYLDNGFFARVPLPVKPAIDFAIERVAADSPEVREADLGPLFRSEFVRGLIEEGFYKDLFGDAGLAEQDAKLPNAL